MIYIIRHGKTDWNIQKKLMGRIDVSLNVKGKIQAENAAQKLKNLHINKIYTSTLKRAQETANIINKYLKKEIVLEDKLREIDYGSLEGLLIKEIDQDTWKKFNLNEKEFNAETFEEVYERVKLFFENLKEEKDDILLVTHGGVLHMIMYYIKKHGKELDKKEYVKDYVPIKINNTDMFKVDLDKWSFELLV